MKPWHKLRLPALCLICSFVVFSAAKALAGTLTNVQTVFLIVLENRDWAGIVGNSSCPYINNTLLPLASRAERYYTPPNLHPSEPNYLWLEAGTNFGIRDDLPPTVNRVRSTNHLVTLLSGAGISWKAYQENISGAECPLADSFPYIARHNPFVFFDDVTESTADCTNHIRPYEELAADLAANTAARYNFITPNATNDMHHLAPGSLSLEKQSDDWLAREVPKILASPAYANNGALFIVWDEGDNEVSDGPIGLILLSPLAKGHGYANKIYYAHSSLLRTLQEIFGVEPLMGDAVNATDLSDLFISESLRLSAELDSANGLPQLTLSGLAAGRTNVILVSRNLSDWQPLNTNVATANWTVFLDRTATNGGQRFYRGAEFR
jgi:hypothetical protein